MLQEWDIPFLFLTNNSQRTRRDVATKLQRMGIPVEEEHIFTCAMATARFLAAPEARRHRLRHRRRRPAQRAALNGYSVVDKSPDYVVVGEGRTLRFEMLEHAVQMVLDGAKLIATNLDPNCPTQARHAPRLRRDRRADRSGHRRQGVQRRQAQPRDDAGRPQGARHGHRAKRS